MPGVCLLCLQIAARLGGEAALLASITSQAGSQKLVEQMQKVSAASLHHTPSLTPHVEPSTHTTNDRGEKYNKGNTSWVR